MPACKCRAGYWIAYIFMHAMSRRFEKRANALEKSKVVVSYFHKNIPCEE